MYLIFIVVVATAELALRQLTMAPVMMVQPHRHYDDGDDDDDGGDAMVVTMRCLSAQEWRQRIDGGSPPRPRSA
jgi:hypothetical protein